MANDNVVADRPELSEWQRVLRWREQQLAACGLDETTALRLALVPDLDWHRVAELASRGIPAAVLLDLYVD